jgi:aldose 1-epimerase
MAGQQTGNVVELQHGSGTTARIYAGYGFNCTSFAVMTADGPVELIWSEPDFGPGSPPMLSGIPVLFPFGGRLVGNTFRWRGTEYTVTDGILIDGTAIHGLVLNRPWRILEQIDIKLVGEFQASIDDPDLLAQWPADFQIRMSYELSADTLTCDIAIENPDERPLPYSFATHGYYRTPLGDSDGEANEITVPAARRWVLDEQSVPTGEIRSIEPELDLRSASAIAHRQFNTVYTGLSIDDSGSVACTVRDPASGRTVALTGTGGFREIVVWNPPHRQAIAIEPYTSVVTAFDVEKRGHASGLRVLNPGESDNLRLDIRLIDDERVRSQQ